MAIISIHAPLAGSDKGEVEMNAAIVLFQSTLPSRGATWPPHRACVPSCYFNPRSPRGERQMLKAMGIEDEISIHAPLAGSDGLFNVESF